MVSLELVYCLFSLWFSALLSVYKNRLAIQAVQNGRYNAQTLF